MNGRPPQPTRAVALYYDGEHAPQLTAVGEHQLAEEILRLARQYEVPIYENPELVNLLARHQLGDEIPPSLYRIIAELIAFVYHLKDKSPQRRPSPGPAQPLLGHE